VPSSRTDRCTLAAGTRIPTTRNSRRETDAERKAEAGLWLGGVVPYGYRKAGMKGQSHLVISQEPIPGFELSEADVVRIIYRMCGEEKKSCQRIADYLNRAGVPSSSSAGKSVQSAGKRNRRIASMSGWLSDLERSIVNVTMTCS